LTVETEILVNIFDSAS